MIDLEQGAKAADMKARSKRLQDEKKFGATKDFKLAKPKRYTAERR